ncbi:putative FBD-associated F-box protein At5g56560 [Eutrema salsugineum]|uniref:putative FBD-associated F-box protein At5g56560 n=1 Tax=Eutrema salsugineum TaxID=72664 RepID=UPI000CED35AD|nr:putative FBD-associated F-box protein At5g56560 [Eutrema salsugineum]
MEKKRLNELPDELILKIFSLLPMLKETLATNLISRRWSEEDPWKLVSNVTLNDDDNESVMSFVYGSLFSNDAQTLERLHLKLVRRKSASNIDFVVQVAVNRSVRKLRIDLSGRILVLPRCLSTCKTLKSLIHFTRFDVAMFPVAPPTFYRSSLKSLHLLSVEFSSDDSVAYLLRNCEALEDLVINRTEDDNVKVFNINVPTLRSLSINNSRRKHVYVEEDLGFVINAPALEKLNFKDTCSNFFMFEDMPEVTKANIEVVYSDQSEKFIGSLTSIQRLSLCSSTSNTPYPRGTFFFFLKHLELCTCTEGWTNLLAGILNNAPKIQSLKLESKHSCHHYNDLMNPWIVPKVVPECLSKHLEILEWKQYEGTKQERKVGAYILANATCLKTGHSQSHQDVGANMRQS